MTGPQPLPLDQNNSLPEATAACADGCCTPAPPADPDAAWIRYARILHLLIVAVAAVKEGREAWRGQNCC